MIIINKLLGIGAIVTITLLLSACDKEPVDVACRICGNKPSYEWHPKDSDEIHYICKDCSSICSNCKNHNATHYHTYAFDPTGEDLFYCDDCYKKIVLKE